MNYLLAIIAGAIQGLTEFLPISSTAHLIIFQKLFNLPENQFGLAFDASLHLGTLLAILIFFFKDYLSVFNIKNKLILKLIIGTIPAAILGILLEKRIESDFRSIQLIGITLIVFSFVMIIAEKFARSNVKNNQVSNFKSLVIGVSQSLALVPGVSRSGATISAGLFLGLTREKAARFAFMLSGPIIAGAGAKKFLETLTSKPSGSDLALFTLGIISSFVFGYLTIKYFLRFLATNNLSPFIIYRILLGFALLLIPLLVK
ncbi:MAG: undecaprenyl-diphosphatase UppP [Patescibacteria group bacterium]